MTANDLKLLRGRLGLTQAELAHELRCSVERIEAWEQRARRIPPHAERALELLEDDRKRKGLTTNP